MPLKSSEQECSSSKSNTHANSALVAVDKLSNGFGHEVQWSLGALLWPIQKLVWRKLIRQTIEISAQQEQITSVRWKSITLTSPHFVTPTYPLTHIYTLSPLPHPPPIPLHTLTHNPPHTHTLTYIHPFTCTHPETYRTTLTHTRTHTHSDPFHLDITIMVGWLPDGRPNRVVWLQEEEGVLSVAPQVSPLGLRPAHKAAACWSLCLSTVSMLDRCCTDTVVSFWVTVPIYNDHTGQMLHWYCNEHAGQTLHWYCSELLCHCACLQWSRWTDTALILLSFWVTVPVYNDHTGQTLQWYCSELLGHCACLQWSHWTDAALIL